MTNQPNRRQFLQTAVAATLGLTASGCISTQSESGKTYSPQALERLPHGPQPPAVEFPHFPTRVHAFVWRNWDLVPLARLAGVLGVTTSAVAELGAAMGLGKPPIIAPDIRKRAYITMIRRNWHLLPYPQLLLLLDWTPEELAFTLREDDFLYIKLGSLKPACEPLAWIERDERIREQERWIARTITEQMGSSWRRPAQPLFQFVQELSRPTPAPACNRTELLRFCYSYFALYGDPLLEPDLNPYPDGYLARLAAAGVNGVWMQAILYKLARFPWQPELSARYEERLRNLGRLAARARRHGISLFLYLNEPRAMPQDFFRNHSDLKGVSEGDHATLCISHPDAKRYLVDAIASICRQAPDLGGFFTITASENLTNCWSHGQGNNCPRCREAGPARIIAATNGLFQQGIDQSGGTQRLLAWDWGWADGWAGEIIQQLPAKATLMSVSEWDLPIERGGVKTQVGEYSLSAVGPGPRAIRHWALARARGLKVAAKIQAANSWELSAVPYVPAVLNTARHAANLREQSVTEIMLGWTLGGFPSPNLEAVKEILEDQDYAPAEREKRLTRALETVAHRRYGAHLAPAVVKAWQQCSQAYAEFPFHISVVYQAPLQFGPANLLFAKPTSYAATMVGFAYDDLNSWHGPYPPGVFATQLCKVADGFAEAAQGLRATLAIGKGEQVKAAGLEAGVMSACALHWRSVAQQTRFILARVAAEKQAPTASEIENMRRILDEETRAAVELHGLQMADSRLGFEASNHYFYVPLDLAEKVINCQWLKERWLPSFG